MSAIVLPALALLIAIAYAMCWGAQPTLCARAAFGPVVVKTFTLPLPPSETVERVTLRTPARIRRAVGLPAVAEWIDPKRTRLLRAGDAWVIAVPSVRPIPRTWKDTGYHPHHGFAARVETAVQGREVTLRARFVPHPIHVALALCVPAAFAAIGAASDDAGAHSMALAVGCATPIGFGAVHWLSSRDATRQRRVLETLQLLADAMTAAAPRGADGEDVLDRA